MAANRTVKRKPENPGQVANRMAALRAKRKAMGLHRVEQWLTDAEERFIRDQLRRFRNQMVVFSDKTLSAPDE